MNDPMTFAQWHVIILHFPIVLFMTGFVFDFLAAAFKVRAYPAGHWIAFMAILLTIPTFFSGWELTPLFEQNRHFLLHRDLGIATLSFGLLHGVIRGTLLYKKIVVHDGVYVALSGISSVLVLLAADFGGLITFGYGFFVK